MRLGNDIVDRKATEGHNPRFMDRILNPQEKSRRQDWRLDEPWIWLYWACKEAAYKAIRQTQDIPFHQREFIVSDDMTSIVWHETRLLLHTIQEKDAIFALATDGNPQSCPSLLHAFEQEPKPDVQSDQARALLLDLAAAHLKKPRADFSIVTVNRIPKLQYQDKVLPYATSLTHHGRYVAASLAVP